jgi:hypothetical protein
MTAGATPSAPIARAARRRLPHPLRKLGPGLVAGASENDPTTAGTVVGGYAVALTVTVFTAAAATG